MILRVRSLISIGALVLTLSSCSLLGERKDSTRISLDDGDSDFKQIRVIAPNSSGISSKKNAGGDAKATDEQVADLTKGENVAYSTQFIHPTISAEKYVKDNKINFWQISGNKDYMQETNSAPLPQDLDRASYFFGLGGKLSGDLKIVKDLTDDQKQSMNYDDQKVSDLQAKMIEKDASCEGHIVSIAAAGQVVVKLDDTNIEEILQNTKIDNSHTLREMMKTVDPRTKEAEKVTVIYFRNLEDKTQTQIKGSFDPNLGTLSFPIATGIGICDAKAPQAYVIDMGDYNPIDSKDVSITEENGKKKYVINLRKQVTSDQIKKFKGTGNKSLKDLTFGLSDFGESGDSANLGEKLPVFNDRQQHEQVTQYSFYTNPNGTSKKPNKDDEDRSKTKSPESNNNPPQNPQPETNNIVADENREVLSKDQPLNNLAPETQILNDDGKNDNKTNLNKNKNSKVVIEVPDALKTNEALENKNNLLTTKKKPIAKKDLPTEKNIPPESIARVPEVVQYFSKNVFVTFDPRIAGIAAKFYKTGPYNAGPHNKDLSDYWKKNEWAYVPEKSFLTTEQVKSDCDSYKFNRTINIKTILTAKGEESNYLNLGKPYSAVLFDQITEDSKEAYDWVRSQIVNAMMNIPSPLNNQDWTIRLAFDEQKGFVAYWSSEELSKHYEYSKSTKKFAITDTKTQKWIKASKLSENELSTPVNFPNARKTMSPTLFSVRCLKNNPKKCAGIFQLAIKRSFEPARILSYLDLQKISFAVRGIVTNKLYDGFTHTERVDSQGNVMKDAQGNTLYDSKTNRLSVFVYGGFEFDSTSPSKIETPVTYLNLQQLIDAGYISTNDISGVLKKTFAGTITFDGSLTEYYINVAQAGTTS